MTPDPMNVQGKPIIPSGTHGESAAPHNAGRAEARAQRDRSPSSGLSEAASADSHGDVFIHSHNDYEREHPLEDALGAHADSVEVDVHLQSRVKWHWPGLSKLAHGDLGFSRKQALLVGHSSLSAAVHHDDVEDMYLKPLQQKVEAAGGRLPDGPFTLMLELKSGKGDADPLAAWRQLEPVLKRYESMLTRYENGHAIPGAVNVVISGGDPKVRAAIEGETTRYAAIDGSLEDLDHHTSPALTPQVSARWGDVFGWDGRGAMPEADRQRLRELTARGRDQGIRVRFWEAPDDPGAWKELVEAGAEVNTDQPQRFARWYDEWQAARRG